MQLIVNLLCFVQLVLVGQALSRHGFPDVTEKEFSLVLAVLIVPIAVFLERIIVRKQSSESKSLIGLEIEARKAKLRREIEELNSQSKS